MRNLFLILIIFVFCFSCAQEKYKFNMPNYEDVMMISNSDNLPFNINFTKEQFPKNLNKVIQTKNDTILNILEYDKNGNLLFKFYKQFVGENWNGKYLTIIERNKFDKNNRLIETIVLNSNTGASLNKYNYDSVDNLIEVLKSNIEANGDNNNPWIYIEKINSFSEFDKDYNVINIQKNKNYSKEVFIYDSLKREVKNYFLSDENESVSATEKTIDYFLYRFDKDNRLISRILIANKEQELNNSYKIKYLKNKIEKIEYENNEVSSITNETINNGVKTIEEVGKGDIKYTQIKKFNGKTLVSLINKDKNNKEEDREEYELDQYNLPIKMNFKSEKKSYSVTFKNQYIFY